MQSTDYFATSVINKQSVDYGLKEKYEQKKQVQQSQLPPQPSSPFVRAVPNNTYEGVVVVSVLKTPTPSSSPSSGVGVVGTPPTASSLTAQTPTTPYFENKIITDEEGVVVGYESPQQQKSVFIPAEKVFLRKGEPIPQPELVVIPIKKSEVEDTYLFRDKNIYFVEGEKKQEVTSEGVVELTYYEPKDFSQTLVRVDKRQEYAEKLAEQIERENYERWKQNKKSVDFWSGFLSPSSPKWDLWVVSKERWEEQEELARKEYYELVRKSNTFPKAFRNFLFQTKPGQIASGFVVGSSMVALTTISPVLGRVVGVGLAGFGAYGVGKTIKNWGSYSPYQKKLFFENLQTTSLGVGLGVGFASSTLKNAVLKEVSKPKEFESNLVFKEQARGVGTGTYKVNYKYEVFGKKYDVHSRINFKIFDDEGYGVGTTKILLNNKEVDTAGFTYKARGVGKEFGFDKAIVSSEARFGSGDKIVGFGTNYGKQTYKITYKDLGREFFGYENLERGVLKVGKKQMLDYASYEKKTGFSLKVGEELFRKVEFIRGKGVFAEKPSRMIVEVVDTKTTKPTSFNFVSKTKTTQSTSFGSVSSPQVSGVQKTTSVRSQKLFVVGDALQKVISQKIVGRVQEQVRTAQAEATAETTLTTPSLNFEFKPSVKPSVGKKEKNTLLRNFSITQQPTHITTAKTRVLTTPKIGEKLTQEIVEKQKSKTEVVQKQVQIPKLIQKIQLTPEKITETPEMISLEKQVRIIQTQITIPTPTTKPPLLTNKIGFSFVDTPPSSFKFNNNFFGFNRKTLRYNLFGMIPILRRGWKNGWKKVWKK